MPRSNDDTRHTIRARRNIGQAICIWCGRGAYDSTSCIPHEEREKLARYAVQAGRNWRSRLLESWNKESDELRYIRNSIGPSGLRRLTMPFFVRYLESRNKRSKKEKQ